MAELLGVISALTVFYLLQELQRFPHLHAQLVEVVSELLRERLGPTSEYVSSLISIQAAYINTNHPEFVAGSAAIAKGDLPASQKNLPVINVSSLFERMSAAANCDCLTAAQRQSDSRR